MGYRRLLAIIAVAITLVIGIRVWTILGEGGEPVPALAGTSLTQEPLELSQLLAKAGGKPVLVVFWATWCPECQATQEVLQSLSSDYPVIGVAVDSDDDEEITGYMRKHGLSYQTINDEESSVTKTWRVRAVPTQFIVAPDGQQAIRIEGRRPEWNLRSRLWWATRGA